MAAVDPLVLLAGELQCGLCERFFEQPVSLPCTHVFCSRCIRSVLQGVGVFKNECPTCKQPAYVKDLSRNTKVAAVTELLRGLVDAPQPRAPQRAAACSGGGRKRASPSHAPPPSQSGRTAAKRRCDDATRSDAPASPPHAPSGGRSGSESESDGSHAGAALMAWAARQRELGTPTSSERVALLDGMADIQAALAAVQSRLRPPTAAHDAADAAVEQTGRSRGGDDTPGGPSSEPARQRSAASAEFVSHLTPAELKRMCRSLWARVYDIKLMRRRLGAVALDVLQAIHAADAPADSAPDTAASAGVCSEQAADGCAAAGLLADDREE